MGLSVYVAVESAMHVKIEMASFLSQSEEKPTWWQVFSTHSLTNLIYFKEAITIQSVTFWTLYMTATINMNGLHLLAPRQMLIGS